jgi:hypothetical protein
MLPAIQRAARIAFRQAHAELRQELIAEVVAKGYAAFVRLHQRGKGHLAFAGPLSRFAIAQTRVGRKVACRFTIRDVMSRYAQYRKDFRVERIDSFDEEECGWKQIVIEDKRSSPADTAVVRLDFSEWLGRLPRLRRKVALTLASGESTSGAARRFKLSCARISQIRKLLKQSWSVFQGEVDEQPRLAVA